MLVSNAATISLANYRAENLFGYSGEELVGRRFDELFTTRDRARAAALLESRHGVLELHCLRKDGTEIEVQIAVGAVVPEADGSGASVVVLRPGAALTQAIVKVLSSSPEAVVIVRRDGRIVLTNDRVEALFGYHPEELLGRPVEILLPARLAEHHVALREAYFREPNVRLAHARSGDLVGRRRDGSEFPVDIMLSPVNAEVGLLVIASIRDATDRIQMEEVRLTAARAEEALRLRDEFVALAAHELRTPMTPLRMVVDRIVRGERREGAMVDPQLARQLDDSVRRLEDTVAALLETANLLAGERPLTREEMDLSELVREEIERVRKQSERAGVRINVSAAPSLRGHWDRGAIRKVVAELLSNAIKFDGGAPIEVTLEREGDSALLTVCDRGIGVAPENRERLFGRFARFESSRHYAGLGIGLWLAKQLVEQHGGHISARGEGEGATFRVALPLT